MSKYKQNTTKTICPVLDNVARAKVTEVNINVIDAAAGSRTATAVALAVVKGAVKIPFTGHPVVQPNLQTDCLTGANISGNNFSHFSVCLYNRLQPVPVSESSSQSQFSLIKVDGVNGLNDELGEHEGHPESPVVLGDDEWYAGSDTNQRNQGPYPWCQRSCLENIELVVSSSLISAYREKVIDFIKKVLKATDPAE